MLFLTCYCVILQSVGFIFADMRSNKRCGWLYGNTCKCNNGRINAYNDILQACYYEKFCAIKESECIRYCLL